MSSPWLPDSVLRRSVEEKSYSNSRGLYANPCDLVTEDAPVTVYERENRSLAHVVVVCENIPAKFCGFADGVEVEFILKSSITQLGVNAENPEITIDKNARCATIKADLVALSPLGVLMLDFVTVGACVGKLFAKSIPRRVRAMHYVTRLLNAVNQKGERLLSYDTDGESGWHLEVVNGRVLAFLPILSGSMTYTAEIHSLLPTIGAALRSRTAYKDILRLHQVFHDNYTRVASPNGLLMVRAHAIHLGTMFGRVVDELLPPGLKCMASRIIEPNIPSFPKEQNRTFVFYGESHEELTHIPIEFYALEPYREQVPFKLRKTLAQRCANKADVLRVFATAPKGKMCCSTYICQGHQFDQLSEAVWVTADPKALPFVGYDDPEQQQNFAQDDVYQQCEYGILSAIAMDDITSGGVLFTRYFPSPCLRSLILSRAVGKKMRAIFFTQASRSHGEFFSQQDSSLLCDLNTFGIYVILVDEARGEMFQFIRRHDRDAGVFVPIERRQEYLLATFFGVYGSNLVEGDFEAELVCLLNGILRLKRECGHALLNPNRPLALVTGGGPGAMEVGNRVAKSLGILSVGLFVDFGSLVEKPGATINEQKKNEYVEAFMTYRPDKIVERQSDFNLDFPIFLTGGIGTDFEYALEEVRRKVGTVPAHPIILFGTVEHYASKISGRYQENLRSGTIKGSEWICTIPWVVSSGREALEVYTLFFNGKLPVGPGHALNDRGFVVASEYLSGIM